MSYEFFCEKWGKLFAIRENKLVNLIYDRIVSWPWMVYYSVPWAMTNQLNQRLIAKWMTCKNCPRPLGKKVSNCERFPLRPGFLVPSTESAVIVNGLLIRHAYTHSRMSRQGLEGCPQVWLPKLVGPSGGESIRRQHTNGNRLDGILCVFGGS